MKAIFLTIGTLILAQALLAGSAFGAPSGGTSGVGGPYTRNGPAGANGNVNTASPNFGGQANAPNAGPGNSGSILQNNAKNNNASRQGANIGKQYQGLNKAPANLPLRR